MDTLGEFVKLLLLAFEKANLAFPMQNQALWHALFYRLKHSAAPHKPVCLEDLLFDWDGIKPRAPKLAKLLSGLIAGDAVQTRNPLFDEWRMNPGLAELWERSHATLGRGEQQFLDLAVALAKNEFRKATPRVA